VIKTSKILRFWPKLLRKSFAVLCCLIGIFFFSSVKAQVALNGKVYESGTEIPLPGASILNKSTKSGELTDRYGYFSIEGKVGDSIQISFLGYLPKTYAIPLVPSGQKIIIQNFFLPIKKFLLKEVEVMARPNFRRDSLLNREENRTIFNYKKPSTINTILGAVFNPITGLDNLVHAAKRNRLRNFQEKLEIQEQDKSIDIRYNRQLVSGLTGLQGKDLENFMKLYRPSFEYAKNSSDYDLYLKIKEDYADYLKFKSSNLENPPITSQ
jgi:CarboxypepD_reg-like domain